MKRTILIFIFATMMFAQARSQVLPGSIWIAYDTTNSVSLYYQFSADTISYSYNNTVYTPLSTYSQAANTVNIVDINTLFCSNGDTGTYNLTTEADSLKFILINDPCTSRSDYLIYHNFVQIFTGIKSEHFLAHIKTFPNPFNENLNFNIESNKSAELILYDICMHKVIQESFTNFATVNTAQLSSGIYFYTIKNDYGFATGRVEKQ